MPNIDILKKYGFKFNHNLGQNFIFDTNLLANIVSLSQINNNSSVLEIGCGAGTLTKEISKVAKYVVGYEIDKALIPILQENLNDCTNCKIIYENIMDVSIADIEKNFETSYDIIANLPYYITTPIIFKFLESSTKLNSITIMVQNEVGSRICAKANTPEYGSITPLIDLVGEAKILKVISKKMFTPIPKVDSAIINITFRKKYEPKDFEFTKKLIRCSFAMRRKTLVNNLKCGLNIPSDIIILALQKLNLNPSIRGEVLTTSDFVNLSDILYNVLV